MASIAIVCPLIGVKIAGATASLARGARKRGDVGSYGVGTAGEVPEGGRCCSGPSIEWVKVKKIATTPGWCERERMVRTREVER